MNFQERQRPQFHFTPPQNWMNDPNGLIYYDGEYHLYYQHNPYEAHWGHMSWGHAVSSDLIHWQHLPVALYEDPDNFVTMFSGSAVIDKKNTTGWGKVDQPAMVLIYTADDTRRGDLANGPLLQTIHLAYSTDHARTFTKYSGNPVLDVQEGKFGDPKVFWHDETNQWIMACIRGFKMGGYEIYGSPNLKQWKLLSRFDEDICGPGYWECPDLFPLKDNNGDTHWVLKLNPPGDIRTRYFIGDFDGTAFHNRIPLDRVLSYDLGRFYADVTWGNMPDNQTALLGWINQNPHDSRCWSGIQSIPRELSIIQNEQGPLLRTWPVQAVEELRYDHQSVADITLDGQSDTSFNLTGSQWDIDLCFSMNTANQVGLVITTDGGGIVRAGYDQKKQEFILEHENHWCYTFPFAVTDKTVTMRVLIDRSVVELFAQNGQAALTGLIEDEEICQSVMPYSKNGSAQLVQANVWRIIPFGRRNQTTIKCYILCDFLKTGLRNTLLKQPCLPGIFFRRSIVALKIKSDQTLLFIGDSITDCGRRAAQAPWGGGYVSMFRDMLIRREPEKAITIINKGIGGDTVVGLKNRWADDVLRHKPDWLSIKIGINDLHRYLFNPDEPISPELYEETYDQILARTQKELPQCSILLISPFYISQDTTGDNRRSLVLETLPHYIKVVETMSRKYKTRLVKTHALYQKLLNHYDADTFCPEPVHPNLTGHGVIAEAVYNALSK